MAQDIDIRRFFQRAPRDWLKRYFDRHDVLPDFDWPALKKLKVDPLMEAWLGLGASLRSQMTDDFRNIELLATPSGKLQIIDEAAYYANPEEVKAKLLELEDFYACAFWVFFDRRECWNGAVFYAAADAKSKRYWRKRINLPKLDRLPVPADAERLALALSELFKQKEGRGETCVVHPYRRTDVARKEYYFAYPQDHHQTAIEYDQKGEMTKRPHNPAFEIIFVHDDEEQTLTIWHEGKIDRVRDLQVAFAEAVIGQKIEKMSPRDDRVYDLEPLTDPEFVFKPSGALGIASVELRKLRVRALGENGLTVRVDLDADTSEHVLHQRIERAMSGIPVSQRKVSLVGFEVTFEQRENETKPKTRKFEISWPCSCSIQNDEYGVVLQRLLVEHGIEPRPPAQATESAG